MEVVACSMWDTTCTVQKRCIYQDRVTKYMGRPLHANWYLWIIQPVLALILSGHQTLEINLVNIAPTRKIISKGEGGTYAKTLDTRVTKVSITAK